MNSSSNKVVCLKVKYAAALFKNYIYYNPEYNYFCLINNIKGISINGFLYYFPSISMKEFISELEYIGEL